MLEGTTGLGSDDCEIDLLNDVRKLELCMQSSNCADEFAEEPFDLFSALQLFVQHITRAPVSPQNVIVLNQINVCMLKQMELLIQRKLGQLNDAYEATTLKLSEALHSNEKQAKEASPVGFFARCGMPFFKTITGGAPVNDLYIGKSLQYDHLPVEVYYGNPIVWNDLSSKRLVEVVNRYRRTKILQENEMKVTSIMLKGGEKGDLLEASEALEVAQESYTECEASIDWHVISKELECPGVPRFSDTNCRIKWNLAFNPKVNHADWTPAEKMCLKKAAVRYKDQDWDNIAKEMGNNRSPLDCCTNRMTYLARPIMSVISNHDLISHREKLTELQKISSEWARPKVRMAYYFSELGHRQVNMLINLLIDQVPIQRRKKKEGLPSKPKRLIEDKFSLEDDNFLIQAVERGWGWNMILKHLPHKNEQQLRWRHAELVASGKRAIDILSNDRYDSPLMPKDPANMASILHLLWDSEKPGCSRYGLELGMDGLTPAASMLCKHLEFVHTYLFGPRFPVPRNDDKKMEVACILSVVMQTLHVYCGIDALVEKLQTLQLVGPEVTITHLENVPTAQLPKMRGTCLMPPNTLTLVGLRSLMRSRPHLLGMTSLPIQHQRTEMNMSITSSDRLSVASATDLLKKRVFSLFFLSSCMAKFPKEPRKPAEDPNAVLRIKKKKPLKPASKLKRREKARLLSRVRWQANQLKAEK